MRLHRLTMQAVGPYPGTQVINFDQFSSSGRFLLTGPTGAGKTTIIDALVFALYGQVADTDGSSSQRIRSTLVTGTTPTSVELIFSTTAGVYRVLRSPRYLRPKRRGTGMTEEKASVKLWRLSEPDGRSLGEPLTRAEEVGAEIHRVVGLSRAQFTQTVVLPQGRFAQFLRASSQDRHLLLRDVFGTAVFDHLQAELRERGTAVRRTTRERRAELSARAKVLSGLLPSVVEGPDPTDPLPTKESTEDPSVRLMSLVTAVEPDAASLRALLTQSVETSATSLAPLQRAVDAAQEERRSSTAALEDATTLQALLDRRRRLLAEQAEIDRLRPQTQAQRDRLEAARRASTVAGALRSVRRARREAGSSAEAVQRLLTRYEEDLSPEVLSLQDRDAIHHALEATAPFSSTLTDTPEVVREGAVTELRTVAALLRERDHDANGRLADLTALLSIEQGLPERRTALAEADKELEAQTHLISQLTEELRSRPEEHARLSAALNEAQRAEAALEGARLNLDGARIQAEAASLIESLSAELSASTTTVEQARDAAQRSLILVTQRRHAWISATAATIATELRAGQPCPVCGSTEHPSPAPETAGTVSRQQVEEAEAAQQQAENTLTASVREHNTVTTRLEAARRDSGGLSPEDANQAVQEATDALTRLEAQADELTRLTQELDGFASSTETLRETLQKATQEHTAAQGQVSHQREALAADEARCQTARGNAPSLSHLHAVLESRTHHVSEITEALLHLAQACTSSVTAHGELTQALSDASFSDEEQAASAALSDEELDSLEAAVSQATARQERVHHDLVEDPQIAVLSGSETAHVEQARSRLASADARYSAAVEAYERARSQHERLCEAVTEVEQSLADLGEALEASAALERVVAVTTGDNMSSTPLATWVLLERFREVLVFANARLTQMSCGRYELKHVDDEDGNTSRRDRGLGLAVVDCLHDRVERDPRTLSGGETFYVSLALALALADVVSAESGGVTMETLFVDEGFGSLDPETLQDVLAELGRLQAGGRTVGIVSHVEELRRQIPDRIEVRRTSHGSTLRVIGS